MTTSTGNRGDVAVARAVLGGRASGQSAAALTDQRAEQFTARDVTIDADLVAEETATAVGAYRADADRRAS